MSWPGRNATCLHAKYPANFARTILGNSRIGKRQAGTFVHEVGEDGSIAAERQYWGLLELPAQVGWFETVPEG
jgi:hypothetical protein